MTDLQKTYIIALKSIILSKSTGLKLTLKKAFKTKYSDKWANEEIELNNILKEMKTSMNQGDNLRLKQSIDNWKSFLLIDSTGLSEKISDRNLQSFLRTSDGRFYGGAYTDFIRFIDKLDKQLGGNNYGNEEIEFIKDKPKQENIIDKNQIKELNILTIEHPLTGAKLQVANQDFTYSMMWQEAKNACSNLGSGWRLPTIEELHAMHSQLYLNRLGSFREDDRYWSDTSCYLNEYAWAVRFDSNGSRYQNYKNGPDFSILARAVRNL
jgi:hypothetical protein